MVTLCFDLWSWQIAPGTGPGKMEGLKSSAMKYEVESVRMS